jgi:hypothetical protein
LVAVTVPGEVMVTTSRTAAGRVTFQVNWGWVPACTIVGKALSVPTGITGAFVCWERAFPESKRLSSRARGSFRVCMTFEWLKELLEGSGGWLLVFFSGSRERKSP